MFVCVYVCACVRACVCVRVCVYVCACGVHGDCALKLVIDHADTRDKHTYFAVYEYNSLVHVTVKSVDVLPAAFQHSLYRCTRFSWTDMTMRRRLVVKARVKSHCQCDRSVGVGFGSGAVWRWGGSKDWLCSQTGLCISKKPSGSFVSKIENVTEEGILCTW